MLDQFVDLKQSFVSLFEVRINPALSTLCGTLCNYWRGSMDLDQDWKIDSCCNMECLVCTIEGLEP